MSQHTPGPWHRGENPGIITIETDEGRGAVKELAHIHAFCPPRDRRESDFSLAWIAYREARANARLIAAAPDLLSACQRVREQLLEQGFVNAYEGAMLEAAIAKAEGKD